METSLLTLQAGEVLGSTGLLQGATPSLHIAPRPPRLAPALLGWKESVLKRI